MSVIVNIRHRDHMYQEKDLENLCQIYTLKVNLQILGLIDSEHITDLGINRFVGPFQVIYGKTFCFKIFTLSAENLDLNP